MAKSACNSICQHKSTSTSALLRGRLVKFFDSQKKVVRRCQLTSKSNCKFNIQPNDCWFNALDLDTMERFRVNLKTDKETYVVYDDIDNEPNLPLIKSRDSPPRFEETQTCEDEDVENDDGQEDENNDDEDDVEDNYYDGSHHEDTNKTPRKGLLVKFVDSETKHIRRVKLTSHTR